MIPKTHRDRHPQTHRSSEALSSRTPSLYASPNNACARQCIDVVFPIPGIPYNQLPPRLYTLRSEMVNGKQRYSIPIWARKRKRLTEMIICGTFPSSAITFNLSTVSLFPTISSNTWGLYFSTLPSTSKPLTFVSQTWDLYVVMEDKLTMAFRSLRHLYVWLCLRQHLVLKKTPSSAPIWISEVVGWRDRQRDKVTMKLKWKYWNNVKLDHLDASVARILLQPVRLLWIGNRRQCYRLHISHGYNQSAVLQHDRLKKIL